MLFAGRFSLVVAISSYIVGSSLVAEHRLSSCDTAHCPEARGIFWGQGSNLCPLHWQAGFQPLDHRGSPCSEILLKGIYWFGKTSLRLFKFSVTWENGSRFSGTAVKLENGFVRNRTEFQQTTTRQSSLCFLFLTAAAGNSRNGRLGTIWEEKELSFSNTFIWRIPREVRID